ncbi:MAG: PPC domain-containing protein, partial [Chloroflexi bacterium]|nr:PPC domain-containing protein [Chloroflexota bacterium]
SIKIERGFLGFALLMAGTVACGPGFLGPSPAQTLPPTPPRSTATLVASPSATPDGYEPNDELDDAYGPLLPDEIFEATIHQAEDRDFFWFSVEAGSRVVLELSDIPAGVDYDLRLFDPVLQEIASSTGTEASESIAYDVAADGRLVIEVEPFQGFDPQRRYRLRLTLIAGSVPSGETLLENFEANANGWFEGTRGGARVFLVEGALHIDKTHRESFDNFVSSLMRGQQFGDFDLSVQGTQVEGSDDNEIAVVFGASDEDNLWEFAYSGDGFVGLFRKLGKERWRALDNFTANDAVRQGAATNTVRLVVQAGSLRGYLNGQLVLETILEDYAGGFIGLGCGTFEAPKVHCAFDELKITPL